MQHQTENSTLMNLQDLTASFAIPGVLGFHETAHGLLRASVTTAACTAELYLHGAHLTAWQPAGQQPVLFLSERSAFVPGKAIRGGVPIIFPWFGARAATPESPLSNSLPPAGPTHGFARTAEWNLAFAALAGDDLHLTLTLGPTDESRAFGFDDFQLAYEIILGRELRVRLTVANRADSPLHFEEALHTYLRVADVERVSIDGLADTEYLDKTDNFARKRQIEPTLTFHGETDRPYLNTAATVTLDDPILRRRIHVSKANSQTTVIWNPWSELAARFPDMATEEWRRMVCIETANAAENALTLHPHEAHVLETHIAVSPV